MSTTQECCFEGRIISAPASWQGDRCVDCGELVGPKEHKGEPDEHLITVPSFGCRCDRRPVLAKQEASV